MSPTTALPERSYESLENETLISMHDCSHSGKFGSIGFLNGVMGMANGQRTMNYLRVLTEFINQPEYRNVVPMFGIINEAQANVIGDEVIRS